MRKRLILAAIAAAAMMACGGGKKPDTMGGGEGSGEPAGSGSTEEVATGSLYERLGGKDGITKVVELFVQKVGADNRINAFFLNTDLPKLQKLLVEQICDAASNHTECQYSGRSMVEVHKNMHVKQEHFDFLVEDLIATMKELKVGDNEQQEILAVLGPMSKDIVEP